MNTFDLEVRGMSCGSCVNHVTQALKPIAGVTDVAVDLESGHVHVRGSVDGGPERLVAALTDAGYPAKLADGGASTASAKGPAANPKARRGGLLLWLSVLEHEPQERDRPRHVGKGDFA